MLNRFLHRFRLQFVPVVAALQVEPVSFRVNRVGVCQPRLLLRSEFHANLAGDSACDLFLHGQHVTQIALIAGRPEMMIRRCFNQLRADPHSAAHPHHGAFDHGIHVQLPSDLGQRLLRSLVPDRRCSGDNLQCADLGQIGDELVSHPVSEIFLLGIVGKVFQWKYN